GGDFGDGFLAYGAFDGAGAAAVDEFEVGDLADGVDDAAAAEHEFPGREGLHEADCSAVQRVGGCVADAGDLRFVREEADEAVAGAFGDLGGEGGGLGGVADGGAERARPEFPPSATKPASMSRQSRISWRGRGPARAWSMRARCWGEAMVRVMCRAAAASPARAARACRSAVG